MANVTTITFQHRETGNLKRKKVRPKKVLIGLADLLPELRDGYHVLKIDPLPGAAVAKSGGNE